MSERILYVISAYSGSTSGSGGHYYSARDVASVLQAAWPQALLRILVLGDLLPAPLSRSSVPCVQVSPAGIGLPEFCRQALSSADDFAPTVVHAYDNKSYLFARLIAHRHRAKRFLTKPAGPDPGPVYPYCPDIVCYSDENLSALRSRRRLRTSRLHLIPNRVAFPTQDPARIAALRARIGPGEILLRICRIGEYHRRSIEQTLALAKRMRAEDIPVRAIIIGAPESGAVIQSLQAQAGPPDLFVTDPAYTVDAAGLLDLATYVVGTGRGVVEAAMRKRCVFVPLADAQLPALVTPSDWRALSSANFSARTRNPFTGDPSRLPLVKELQLDAQRAESFVSELSSAIGEAYGPHAIPARYEELYAKDQATEAVEPLDCLANAGSVLIPYLRRRRTLPRA